MMSWREREHEKMLRMYQDETGVTDFQLADVAAWAEKRGWVMPTPPSPVEILTKQLQKTARAVSREDKAATPSTYRAYLAHWVKVDGERKMQWFDVDGPASTRSKVHKSLTLRKEGMVNDGVQIRADEAHWNRSHSEEDPIQIDLDLNDEIDWRINGSEEDETRKAG